jgi:hypothetical protein
MTYLNGIEWNGIDSCLAAVPVDFFGLCTKLAQTRSKSTSTINGRPLDFCLHRRPAKEMWNTMRNNFLGHFWAVYSICKGFVNTCPTVVLSKFFVIPEYIIKRPIYGEARVNLNVCNMCINCSKQSDDYCYQLFKDEWQTALFKDPVRTAQETLFILVIKTNQFMM